MNVGTSATTTERHLETTAISFDRIVVALDLSGEAKDVVRAATEVARCFNSELIFVHAVNPFTVGDEVALTPNYVYAMALDGARAEVCELLQNDSALCSFRYREVIEFGQPLSMVQRAVQVERAGLVVAGSHSPSSLERLALGSVAEAIVEHVSCPVLIVGPGAQVWAHPFRSILFATDAATPNLRGAQYASTLAERFHGELCLLAVMEPGVEREGLDSEIVEVLNRMALERLLPADLPGYTNARIFVEHGEPAELVVLRARTEGCSLIVAGTPRHSFLADHMPGVTLSAIVRGAPCPVLCVPAHLH